MHGSRRGALAEGTGLRSLLSLQARGTDDEVILQKAFAEDWILLTNDKDFGNMVFRERRPHRGVVFLRLDDEGTSVKIETLRRLLEAYSDRLADRFVVVTEDQIRFARDYS